MPVTVGLWTSARAQSSRDSIPYRRDDDANEPTGPLVGDRVRWPTECWIARGGSEPMGPRYGPLGLTSVVGGVATDVVLAVVLCEQVVQSGAIHSECGCWLCGGVCVGT